MSDVASVLDGDITEAAWQRVDALVVRIGAQPWFTVGVAHGQDIETAIGYWRTAGYEVRVMTANVGTEIRRQR